MTRLDTSSRHGHGSSTWHISTSTSSFHSSTSLLPKSVTDYDSTRSVVMDQCSYKRSHRSGLVSYLTAGQVSARRTHEAAPTTDSRLDYRSPCAVGPLLVSEMTIRVVVGSAEIEERFEPIFDTLKHATTVCRFSLVVLAIRTLFVFTVTICLSSHRSIRRARASQTSTGTGGSL